MTNIITGPWTTPPARKPWRRMTKSERAAFKAWEDWLCRDVLCELSRRGRERTGLTFGEAGSFGVLQDAEFFGREGLKTVAMGAPLKAPPPLPTIWPEDFNLDIARAALTNLGEAAA